uniref:Uncharacterized protein n=1 Tax=Tanacetum cinerariifolium TaxID=118510 RepID=A0A699HLA8_TANCI|nr:hypothetical protein [Tanacetum cinerariifolium]
MLVPAAKKVIQAQDDVSIYTEPSTSKPHKKHKYKKQQPKAPKVPSPTPSPEHQLPSPSNDQIPTAKDSLTLQELVDLCTRLSNKVLDLESEFIDIKSSFTAKIQKLEDRVAQLEEENRALKKKSFKTTQVDTAAPVENIEKSFKQGRMIAYMNEDVEEAQAKAYNLDLQHAEKLLIMHDIDEEESAEVEEVLEVVKAAKLMTEVVTTAQPTTTAAQSKDKGKGILIEEPKPLKGQAQIDMDEAFARRLEAKLNANINWNDVIEQVRKNIMIYLKNMAGFKMDFFKEATPLVSKVPLVDYQIHLENNKPYYKIIRADGTHKLFLSFITLLKNFDKEDLKALWKLVKERFETIEPKNFSDDFLLNILKIMFEKPNIEANVWKDQKGRYGLDKLVLPGIVSTGSIIVSVVSMDIVFDGAFGGARDEEVVVGECVVVISSSLDILINNCLGGIMVSLIFLKELDEEALMEFMVEWCEEDEDDDRKEFMI